MTRTRDLAGAANPATLPPLTRRQQEILDYIERFRGEHGYSPTVREIGRHFGIASPRGVACHLETLTRKHRITHQPGHARTIVPLNHRPATLRFGGEIS